MMHLVTISPRNCVCSGFLLQCLWPWWAREAPREDIKKGFLNRRPNKSRFPSENAQSELYPRGYVSFRRNRLSNLCEVSRCTEWRSFYRWSDHIYMPYSNNKFLILNWLRGEGCRTAPRCVCYPEHIWDILRCGCRLVYQHGIVCGRRLSCLRLYMEDIRI